MAWKMDPHPSFAYPQNSCKSSPEILLHIQVPDSNEDKAAFNVFTKSRITIDLGGVSRLHIFEKAMSSIMYVFHHHSYSGISSDVQMGEQ
jgi:hypothetical protein